MRGNSGLAPLKTLDEKALSQGSRRFRFIPLQKRLQSTSARPASLPTTDFSSSLEKIAPEDTVFSHFSAALKSQSEANITQTFSAYVRQVSNLAVSLPLIFRNRNKIVLLTLDALRQSSQNYAEATPSIAHCLTSLSNDLGPEVFHPFFPDIVATFAHVLSTTAQNDTSSEKNPSASSQSVMWDPLISLVPLFAFLAHLTKSHLSLLVANPSQTLNHLLPLLSHPHYRVREMTAEACLGYLIRKTRIPQLRNNFLINLIQFPLLSHPLVYSHNNIIDALGVALFEAVRMPAGRLHSRAPDVLRVALSYLQTSLPQKDTSTSNASNACLMVVSRCMASLCRFLTNESDIQNLLTVIVGLGELAIQESNHSQVANLVFLLRKWLQIAGRTAYTRLGLSYLQRGLNFLSIVLSSFKNDPRVVYECLGAISNLSLNSPLPFQQKSCRTIIPTSLHVLSDASSLDSLSCALRVVLNGQTAEWDNAGLIAIGKSYASACERLAQLSASSKIHDGELHATISLEALMASLRFLRLSKTDVEKPSRVASVFRVPTLEVQISDLLSSSIASSSHTNAKVENVPLSVFPLILEYLCYVQVPHMEDKFQLMFDLERCGLKDSTNLLIAFVNHFDEANMFSSKALQHEVQQLFWEVMPKDEKEGSDAFVLTALNRYFCAYIKELELIRTDKVERFQTLVMLLQRNLSSEDSNVRVQSSSLLATLSAKSCSDPTNMNDSQGLLELKSGFDVDATDKTVMQGIDILRKALESRDSSLCGMYQVMKLLLQTPRSLEAIGSCQRLIQEFIRLVSSGKVLGDSELQAIVHFSIGLIRMPLKMLWKSAGELWCATANHNPEVAMSVIVKHVEQSGNELMRSMSVGTANGLSDDKEDEYVEDIGDEKGMLTERKDVDMMHSETEDVVKDYTEGREDPKALPDERIGRLKQKYDGITMRQKIRDQQRKALHWDAEEWSRSASDSFMKETEIVSSSNASTDTLSFMLELLSALSKESKHTLRYRPRIISMYIRLDPSLFSKRAGNSIAVGFSSLLEKMGGLKCCESDRDLEKRMRFRLLSDLTRTDALLQSSAFRCLCVSRSPFVKPHRESFLRLIKEATFREELTLVTETMFSNHRETFDSEIPLSEGENDIIDVLTRICFSKMRGKKAYISSRRSAVLSFVVSKLPRSIALPRIASLLLHPLSLNVEYVEKMTKNGSVISTSHPPMPDLVVQKGVLSSIESVLKQCRRALPAASWKKLALALFCLLQNAGKGSPGQNLRSRCLRAFADMHLLRPSETTFLTLPTLEAIKSADFGLNGYSVRDRAPALLHFLAAVFDCDEKDVQIVILRDHWWAVQFCLQVMKSDTADVHAIELCLTVAKSLVLMISSPPEKNDSLLNEDGGLKVEYSVTWMGVLSDSLRILLYRLIELTQTNRVLQKMWSDILNASLQLVSSLSSCKFVDQNVLVTLAEGLCSFLISVERSTISPIMAVKALASISKRICCGDNTMSPHFCKVKSLIVSVLPLIAHPKYIYDDMLYQALCELFTCVNCGDLSSVSKIVKDLNAMKSSRLDSPDLDRRIGALNAVVALFKTGLCGNESGFRKDVVDIFIQQVITDETPLLEERLNCGSDALLALFYGCMAAVRTDDTAIRGTAGYALQLMSRWAGFSETKTASIFRQEVFKLLTTYVASAKKIGCRREYCKALGELMRSSIAMETDKNWNGYSFFTTLKSMGNSKDVESDFFENLVHLQAHRRSKALRMLDSRILELHAGTEDIHSDAIVALSSLFSLPLGMNLALEQMDSDDRRKLQRSRRHGESREDAQRDVSVWAIALVGSSAKVLRWPQYKECLSGILKKLRGDVEEEKAQILYKLLVAITQAFPMTEDGSEMGIEDSVTNYLVNQIIPEMLRHVSPGALEGRILDKSNSVILPSSGMRKGSSMSNTFHAPVAIGISQLMTRLPQENIDTMIPLLVTPLANVLRSRMSDTRNAAKKSLVSVVLTLGPKYMAYILQQILSALSEGFRKDSCVYIIQSLLEGVHKYSEDKRDLQESSTFTFDDTCHIITSFLCDELESGLGETKKNFEDPNASASRQRQASVRATKACECVEILGQNVTFLDMAIPLCVPFLTLLSRTTSSKLKSRIHDLLQRLGLGLSRNGNAKPNDAFKFCYSLMSSVPLMQGQESEQNDVVEPTSPVLDHSWFGFGLHMLNVFLAKHMIILSGSSKQSRQLQAMCEPFLPLLVKALHAGKDDLTISAFRATQRLLKLPLSNKSTIAGEMSETIVHVLSQGVGVVTNAGTVSSGDELFNTCLRAAAVLLREVGTKGFNVVSKERVEALLAISCTCIESGSSDSRSAALSLLRSVVSSKIIIPPVYDVMEKVNKMAIHAQSSSLQSSCTSLSVMFLVSFPLGSKRVRQHLEFFVRNLNYELASGRLAALEALNTVISKFPTKVLDNESEYLFLVLAANVSRDVDADCRLCASKCLQTLFERVSVGRKLAELLRIAALLAGVQLSLATNNPILQKCDSAEVTVQRSGASCLTTACRSGRMTMLQLHAILRVCMMAWKGLSDDTPWETLHSFMHCIEACFEAQPNATAVKNRLEIQKTTEIFWAKLPSLLLHKQQWIRQSAVRLLGSHLSAAGGRKTTVPSGKEESVWVVWTDNDLVRDMLKSLCLQLEADHLSVELAQQGLKSILCMADVIRNNPSLGNLNVGEIDRNVDVVLNIGHNSFEPRNENRTLRWLLARMSGMALKSGSEQSDMLRRGCSLRFLVVTSKWWGLNVVTKYMQYYTSPVVKVLESGEIEDFVTQVDLNKKSRVKVAIRSEEKKSNYVNSEDGISLESLRSIAQILQNSIIEAIGATKYYNAYHQARNRRDAVRQERKRRAAVAAAVDPERAAKKRRLKSQARSEKKRKPSSNGKQVWSCESAAKRSKNRLTEDM